MKFGVNIQIWTSRFTNAEFPLIDKVREMGFDVMEVLFGEEGPEVDTRACRAALQAAGLEPTVCLALSTAHDLTNDDPVVRRAGVHYMKSVVAGIAALGGQIVCGPVYAALFKARYLTAAGRFAFWNRLSPFGIPQSSSSHDVLFHGKSPFKKQASRAPDQTRFIFRAKCAIPYL